LTWEGRHRTLRSAPEPDPQKQQKCRCNAASPGWASAVHEDCRADQDQEIPTGPGVVIAKPNGGSTSNAAKKKAFCAQQLAVLNQDLQDVGAGKPGSDILAHDVYAAGQTHGCSWAKG
jgi:hypothetical protein